jgi:hypothetical protein
VLAGLPGVCLLLFLQSGNGSAHSPRLWGSFADDGGGGGRWCECLWLVVAVRLVLQVEAAWCFL